jgi:hypothetical protein
MRDAVERAAAVVLPGVLVLRDRMERASTLAGEAIDEDLVDERARGYRCLSLLSTLITPTS